VSRYRVMYGPQFVNEFNNLQDAIDMCDYESERGPRHYVYDRELDVRHDLEDPDTSPEAGV